MAEIKNSIKFTKKLQEHISAKKKIAGFNYKSWSDEDLTNVRKKIRDFYRQEQKGICGGPLS